MAHAAAVAIADDFLERLHAVPLKPMPVHPYARVVRRELGLPEEPEVFGWSDFVAAMRANGQAPERACELIRFVIGEVERRAGVSPKITYGYAEGVRGLPHLAFGMQVAGTVDEVFEIERQIFHDMFDFVEAFESDRDWDALSVDSWVSFYLVAERSNAK